MVQYPMHTKNTKRILSTKPNNLPYDPYYLIQHALINILHSINHHMDHHVNMDHNVNSQLAVEGVMMMK